MPTVSSFKTNRWFTTKFIISCPGLVSNSCLVANICNSMEDVGATSTSRRNTCTWTNHLKKIKYRLGIRETSKADYNSSKEGLKREWWSYIRQPDVRHESHRLNSRKANSTSHKATRHRFEEDAPEQLQARWAACISQTFQNSDHFFLCIVDHGESLLSQFQQWLEQKQSANTQWVTLE